MKKTIALLLAFFAIVMTSCKKEEKEEYTDTPVIESYLLEGTAFSVKISRQIPFSDEVVYSSDDIDQLDVKVEYNHTSYALTAMGNGVYTNTSLVVMNDATYTLSFYFNQKEVSAYTYIPSKPQGFTQSATEISIARMDSASGPPTSMPDPIELNWTNNDDSYYLVYVECIETTLDPIRDTDGAVVSFSFRKAPTNGSTDELRPMEFQYYGTHRIILYHVLPDYAFLYENNGTSSLNLTNPSTGIVNGYGIFTGLNTDTLFIEVLEP
jgi:hypothetical protein